ncbi:phosphatase PAP2 family protein [Dyadobacter subterraneus]|uniref:Phosphatase PAP2 family protein n=1 Tax=Dyadobacter subterraneus TaxID=2773304 RepID=A0ABR9WBU4_9BACT|nr:phosphatase PAP2 family protein [Dyadobacter subterraneus]MBE9462624.1 phosphatase PAP2 family protein [Dyadobacter subterraneus]
MKTLVICLSFSFLLQLPVFSQTTDTTRHETRFSTQQLYAPALLVMAGLIANGHSQESIKNELAEDRNRHMAGFKTKLDNYLQFSPFAIAYGLDAIGIKSKTDFMNRSVILLKGELLAIGTATLLKRVTHELRPDGSAYNSFPSGHTTQAFAAATFLSEEYKDRYKWMPYASYTVASSVGLMRVANNRHYISDVLVGAGIGFLSMKVAYWTHQYKWGKKNRQIAF